jgi:hypothetical protein
MLNEIMNDPVWLMTIFFIIIAWLIVAGRAKGALVLAGIIFIAIITRKYWPGGAREAFADMSSWLARKEFGPETESEKAAYSELIGVIPSVGQIDALRTELFTRLGQYFTNPSVGNMTPGFVIGMLDRLDHYFRLLYANLHSTVLDPDYPQRNMVYALDTQRQILQTLHNFVFVDGSSSDMPKWLAKSRADLSLVFGQVNNAVADYVNARNSQPDVINRHSGFLAHPSDPLPNGTFRDKYDLY